MLNDRSSGRSEEEQRYTDSSSQRPQDGLQVAQSQWLWTTRVLGPRAAGSRLSVLDIGCGYGDFLSVARDAGARTYGVELDPAGVAACREAGIEVVQGSVYEVGVPQGPWDVITFWDVLDHLELPPQALDLAAGALAARGVLIVRGRNARLHCRVKRVFGRASWLLKRLGIRDLSVVHRWGFTPEAYASMMERTGLVDVRLHPGLPTPGDRHRSFDTVMGRVQKRALGTICQAIYAATWHRGYLYPSVLVAGRRPSPHHDLEA